MYIVITLRFEIELRKLLAVGESVQDGKENEIT